MAKHKNIHFSPQMDEWSILTRLQDYEEEMKKKSEKDTMKKKQADVNDML